MPNQPREGTSAVTFSMDDALLERAEYLAERLCEEHPGLRFTRFDAIRATLARNLPFPPAGWKPKSEVRHQATATLVPGTAASPASTVSSTPGVVSSSLASSKPAASSAARSPRGGPSSEKPAPPSSKRTPSRKAAAADPVEVPEDINSTLEVPVFSRTPPKPSSKRPRR